MFSIYDQPHRLCDRLTRRAILRAGSLATLGAVAPALRSHPALASGKTGGRAKSVIVLFLLGGPPQHSTWDPKPEAPAQVRGEFGPISTNVPGLQICELLPRSAQIADKLAILRAVATNDNAHSSSGYFMMTGVPHIPTNVENAKSGAPNDWPTMGAVFQHLGRNQQSLLPPAVRLPHHIFNTDGSVWPGQVSGWLGLTADPWLFNCQPASPTYDVPEFRLSADVSLDRLSQRRTLLNQFESQLRNVDQSHSFDTYSNRQRQAFELLSSPAARAACDLQQEPDEVRDRYGRSQFGQSVLLARRLVEADVEFVQVNWYRGPDEPSDNPCWDSHTNESERLKTVLVPPLDQAMTALFLDLEEKGRLHDTLVVCMAEFGRTPKFNGRAGRDHWGHVFSIAMGGGGIRGGQVLGASDEQGGYPKERMVQPQDITATIFHCLGYAPETEIHDPLDRPLPISRGNVIDEIV